ncbi:hypothetical protein CEXT_707211 [Caerostris extrusa]|uniref:Uncharacterized protein n=1 Tax=Caerostris extrusa TaxID=172846 RepID=A0AAV4R5D1_CAEEX|nr:hypothetical protein CEXT_707211 [Caerostris extrusa]
MVILGRVHRIHSNRYHTTLARERESWLRIPVPFCLIGGPMGQVTYRHHLHAWLRMVSGVRHCLPSDIFADLEASRGGRLIVCLLECEMLIWFRKDRIWVGVGFN